MLNYESYGKIDFQYRQAMRHIYDLQFGKSDSEY